jgi:hypothetical protein
MNMKIQYFPYREDTFFGKGSRGKRVREIERREQEWCVCQNVTSYGTMNNFTYVYVDVYNETHNVKLNDISI